jgi:pyruvate/2-oxoglutarate dehydrogenase complex dihydrolipoamide dehydrogenase (E3) component
MEKYGMMDQYDAIIIGAGQAGVPLATALAEAGWKTALIEAKYLGGTCINYGCTPTKTMVASAAAAYLARRAADFGVQAGPVSVDMSQVRQRKGEVVGSFRAGIDNRLKIAGVETVSGQARFRGPKNLLVRLNEGGEREMTSGRVIVDTGSRPRIPPIDGLSGVSFLDSTSIMELDEVPKHLLILGGGYVAIEFGQMFRRFGSQVTIIEQSGRLLSREDEDISAAVAQILKEDGLQILLNSTVRKVEQAGDGKIRLQVTGQAKESTRLEGSHLLVAIGRAPNTEELDLAAAGIQSTPQGFIQVNDCLETNVPGVYATGDVNGGPAFTHISYDDYRILKTNLLEQGSATTKDRLVPYVVFMDPQLGRVGLSEREAQQQDREIRVAKMPMEWVARAIEIDQTRGIMKAIVDAKTHQILGAAVLGVEGGEIMSALEIAMLGKLPYPALRDAIFAHPTLAESLNNLFATLT